MIRRGDRHHFELYEEQGKGTTARGVAVAYLPVRSFRECLKLGGIKLTPSRLLQGLLCIGAPEV